MKKSIEFANLRIDIQSDEDVGVYRFQGDVDEYFRHDQVPILEQGLIQLHLAGVNNFNSVGIREWIHFVGKLVNASTTVFQECSVNVIDQINMIPNTLAGGIVESFYAPYYCQCGNETNKLIQVAACRDNLNEFEAPAFTCKCGKTLEFDAIEESYFQFLTKLPKVG
jgi:hypothetical protein